VKAWIPVAAVCAAAVVRALTARPLPSAAESDLATRHKAFRAIVDGEATMRKEGAKTFPTDLWSRDDDFHKLEWQKARDWASAQRARPGDVLSAIDEGIRERWPYGAPSPLAATVPPCRPRAIY
jgi:hypothetical protein